MQGKKVPFENEEKIYSLRNDEGLTYKQIASRFGLNARHLSTIIRRVQKRKDNQQHDYS